MPRRAICHCLALALALAVPSSRAGRPPPAPTPLTQPRAAGAEQSTFATFAGPVPWGGDQAVFLFGEDWTPQLFDHPPTDIEIGAQGTLKWQPVAGGQRQVVRFDEAEVPIGADSLLADPAASPGTPPQWEKRSRKGAALLICALAPGDPRGLSLLRRWHRDRSLDSTQWAWALRACGYPAALAAAAKTDPAATYELLTQLFYEARWDEARALLKTYAPRIDAVAGAVHDRAERRCAPVHGASRRPSKRPQEPGGPTHLSWARLLDIAVMSAQGHSQKAAQSRKRALEVARALKLLDRQSPRWRESAFERPRPNDNNDHPGDSNDHPSDNSDGAVPGPAAHELFAPDRPRALLGWTQFTQATGSPPADTAAR